MWWCHLHSGVGIGTGNVVVSSAVVSLNPLVGRKYTARTLSYITAHIFYHSLHILPTGLAYQAVIARADSKCLDVL